jgi:membrane-bound serine protease (ClpP class)
MSHIRSRVFRASALVLALGLALLALRVGAQDAPADGVAALLDIEGPIGPATSDYVSRSLEKASEQGAEVVILRMDTPGGLDTSMRDIIQEIIASPVPVVTFVAPSGARAASAGTYILYASHVVAMAPGTNLGAATPIQIGAPTPKLPIPDMGRKKDDEEGEAGEEDRAPPKTHPTMSDKAVSDAVAYIRSLAQMRGRNADWAEKAVSEAASLPAAEALEMGVIDLIADNIDDLLAKIDGRTVELAEGARELATAAAEIVHIAPDWRTELLAVITNPNVAYMLLLIGIYGLIYEVTHPGVVVPGVVGAISLCLALFALHVLPVNYAGLALILLGVAFMVAEAFVPAFGALGIGGLIALVVGSIMLMETDVPGYGISWPLIAGVAVTSGAAFVLILTLAVRAQRRPVVSGAEAMVGSLGRVTDWEDGGGRVRVQGELWQASAPAHLEPGNRIRVAAIEGLTLKVEPAEEKGET